MKKYLFNFSFFLLFFLRFAYSQVNCMQMGINLSSVNYYTVGENPFIDQMKLSSNFWTYSGSVWNTNLFSEIIVDSEGYPSAGVPQNTSGGMQNIRKILSSDGRVPGGSYVFMYDGVGTFQFAGTTFSITSTLSGKIYLTIPNTTANLWINIISSSASPNHARNFRLVPLSEEFTFESKLFRQKFVNVAKNFQVLRFLEWGNLNSDLGNNSTQFWNQRTTPNYNTQGEKSGVAYEYIYKLCNKAKVNPWICLPHLVDSTYIYNLAKMFKDSLDPSLNVYIEYSNECWNYIFKQTHWIIQDVANYPSSWPLNTEYDASLNLNGNYGKLCKRRFRIFRNAFGVDSSRVIRVLAGQTAVPLGIQYSALACGVNNYDVNAITWYFGCSPNQANTWPSTLTVSNIIDSCRKDFTSRLSQYRGHVNFANSINKKIVCYEGGQHLSVYGNASAPTYTTMALSQNNIGMYNLYKEVIDSLREWNFNLINAYSLSSKQGIHGWWGHINHVDSNVTSFKNIKMKAIYENLPDSVGACSTLDLNDIQYFSNTCVFFPNPVISKLVVKSTRLIDEIEVIDLLGRTIIFEKPNLYEMELLFEHNLNGVYIVKIRQGGNLIIKKIVKQ